MYMRALRPKSNAATLFSFGVPPPTRATSHFASSQASFTDLCQFLYYLALLLKGQKGGGGAFWAESGHLA